MATLVSPGVSVTVTDESFFIPVSAATVPLFFVATGNGKLQSDGLTPAEGTEESNVIRTVTSLKQSTELYGVPVFHEDANGNPHHGDATNEYGIFALNQFLGIGNKAYVIRAEVNLNNDALGSWQSNVKIASTVLNLLIEEFLIADATPSGSPPVSVVRTEVTSTELRSLARTAMADVFLISSFTSIEDEFFGSISAPSGLLTYPQGDFTQPSDGVYDSFDYISDNLSLYSASPGYPGTPGTPDTYTAEDGELFLLRAGSEYERTFEFSDKTSLGANDADRRATIVTALQASVVSNTDIRAESFDYNLILCPGYPEITDELLSLAIDMQEEALVISDTPMDLDVDGITNPGTGWAGTSARIRSSHIAYYYPSALSTNLDGKNVAAAASGVALRTYTFSDNVSFLWFAPAGLRRGLISGVSELGYVSGNLGGPTSFIPLALNPGERDALYQYGAASDINPLVFFPGQGFVVWGQKTSAVAASAVDRVNVSRLMKYIKRQLRKNTLSFVFEPNDALTRDNLKAVVDNFLGDLVVKRGLYDFVTVCDESNNTPDRIDRNEMYVDIAVKPVKAAEFIYIPIRIVATGAEI